MTEVAGFAPRLKWPNDLVLPGDGSAPDRKLAGILAEADCGRATAPRSSSGIGINVAWPAALPEELAEVAVACNHVTDRPVDREDLLVALLRRLDGWYGPLLATLDVAPPAGGLAAVLGHARPPGARRPGRRARSRARRSTSTDEGHLVVEATGGDRRTIAVGDVVHLPRPQPLRAFLASSQAWTTSAIDCGLYTSSS